MQCPECSHENQADASKCANCDHAFGTVSLVAEGQLELRALDVSDTSFQLQSPGAEGYILGRSDERGDYIPDIDLAPFQAREKGVSRRHAALVRYHNKVHLLDLNSVNGTFLNGERLGPGNPQMLQRGDVMRLGNFGLSIFPFEK